MMTLAFGLGTATYLAFYGAAAALILAPGPDTACVLTRGLDDRGPGIRSVLGIATSVPFHTLLVAVGTAALFRTVPGAATTLKHVGATYLGYLGITSPRNDESDLLVETDIEVNFRRGVLVNALNPKVTLFFLAFLPGFAGQGAGAGVRMMDLDTTYAAPTALYLSVVALSANRLGSRLVETQVTSALDYVSAGTMLLLGVVPTLE